MFYRGIFRWIWHKPPPSQSAFAALAIGKVLVEPARLIISGGEISATPAVLLDQPAQLTITGKAISPFLLESDIVYIEPAQLRLRGLNVTLLPRGNQNRAPYLREDGIQRQRGYWRGNVVR